jgi:hypothetical protein
MKFGILKKRVPDRRVVFSPDALVELKQLYPIANVKVESSDIRIFTDNQYVAAGIEVSAG